VRPEPFAYVVPSRVNVAGAFVRSFRTLPSWVVALVNARSLRYVLGMSLAPHWKVAVAVAVAPRAALSSWSV
jgi:hypothetical protein